MPYQLFGYGFVQQAHEHAPRDYLPKRGKARHARAKRKRKR